MAELVHDDLAAVATILRAVRANAAATADAAPAIVLIDGPSGAGKSTLADALLVSWPAAQLLRMDSIVPGWDGLAASSAQLEGILDAFATGRRASARHWDWATDAPGAAVELDPARPLVVEGSGSITTTTASLAPIAVWVDLDDDGERRRRAIDRDGATYEPHWDRWAAQEATHARHHRPMERAAIVVDRSP